MSFNTDMLAAELRDLLKTLLSGTEESPLLTHQTLRKWAIEQAIKTDGNCMSQHAVISTANALIEYVTGADPEVYFFTKDDSSHWYMIPVPLRTRWNNLMCYGVENDHIIEAEFGKYRTGGGIDHIAFKIVSK